jgi:hypothetical protein
MDNIDGNSVDKRGMPWTTTMMAGCVADRDNKRWWQHATISHNKGCAGIKAQRNKMKGSTK